MRNAPNQGLNGRAMVGRGSAMSGDRRQLCRAGGGKRWKRAGGAGTVGTGVLSSRGSAVDKGLGRVLGRYSGRRGEQESAFLAK
jgi:hypothetical protein